MEKRLEGLTSATKFRKAFPISESVPPVPEIDTRTEVLEKGSVHAEGAYALPCDILVEYDVGVELRDGTVLWADVYRPVGDEAVPLIIAYTPYCKRGGWWNENFNATKFGVPAADLSGLQAFEAPDPGHWCDKGYAIAYVDAAGTSRSGGDEVFMGTASGRNVYDVIEWFAGQEWCTGKIGLAGNSQLAMTQWAAAAEQPPHLAAIAPWEGVSDLYREVTMRGGIPDTKFHVEDIAKYIYGENHVEDVTGANVDSYPLMNDYWADKIPDFNRITVPAYVVASWTSPIHAAGTVRAYRSIASKEKWLRVHNDQEWLDGADPVNIQDLQRFFDHYLKGIDNDWKDTPPVRLSVIDPGGSDIVGRPEQEWPLARQEWRRFHLDAANGTLSDQAADDEASVEYDGADQTASVCFSTKFDEDTEINGFINLRLWVEAAEAQDMDLFAAIYKEDSDGRRLHHITLRAPEARGYVQSLEQDGKLPATLSYTGPVGRLRVSHRQVDPDRSAPGEPYLTHAEEQMLTPGECVPVDLALWPTAMIVRGGERLILEIAGHPVGPVAPPNLPGGWLDIPARNKGLHRIRTGGKHDSHLLLPVVP